MYKDNVPQDQGALGDIREVVYALDENGRYIEVKSAGWEPKNIAVKQAWDIINEKVANALKQVKSGELSPVAYYMAKNQMDIKLLSKYTKFSKRTINKHLNPQYFSNLSKNELEIYAKIFDIKIEQLQLV